MSLSAPSPLSRLRRITSQTLDLLLPPLCLNCDRPVAAHRTLCAECWGKIHFITPPYCSTCGAPFDIPMGDDALCASCVMHPPQYTAARAPMLYDDATKHIVIGFKHADRTYPAPALAGWMMRAGQEFAESGDILTPVPLHRLRLYKRRYNQAALLAHELKKLMHKPMMPDLLLRKRATPMQGHLNRKDREDNVKGAFTINPRHCTMIEDKTIILIDDVLTTGATVNECSRILLKAGVKAVQILTLARVKGLQ